MSTHEQTVVETGTRGAELLERARSAHSGRATELIHGGPDTALRQVMLALVAGRALDDHENPGEAILQLQQGRVRLSTTDGAPGWDLAPGDGVRVPPQRHRVDALEDSVAVLTLVPRDRLA